MPRGDGTGPIGQGPRTGGGFGNCDRNLMPQQRGWIGRRLGRRMGRINLGGGSNDLAKQGLNFRGGFWGNMRHCFSRFWGDNQNVTMDYEDEKNYLTNLKENLEKEKSAIEKRLLELDKEKKSRG